MDIYPCKKFWILAHFYSVKFKLWEEVCHLGKISFSLFFLGSMPIHSLVHISEIQKNMHCNVSRVVMYLCSQCEFISWLNIMSYSLFTWKRDQNGRLCLSAYAAKWCSVLWLNHEGSKRGLNKFVTKDNAALLWTPYKIFIHEKRFVRCGSNYCPNCFSRAIQEAHLFFYNNSLRELSEQEAVAIVQLSIPLTHNI